MIKIVSLTQTTSACPTQWEGLTDNGEKVYVRFRFGNLSISIDGKPIFKANDDSGWNGVLSFDNLIIWSHNKGWDIIWPKEETPETQEEL